MSFNQAVVKASFAEEPPFAMCPCVFELRPGQPSMLEVSEYSNTMTMITAAISVRKVALYHSLT